MSPVKGYVLNANNRMQSSDNSFHTIVAKWSTDRSQ